jgi:hypothetical protein
MARRKSIKKVAQDFQTDADDVKAFASAARASLTAQHTTWAYEYAVIRLYRDFEDLMLNALKGAINNDTSTLSETVNIEFPQSLSDAVCEYIVTGGGYFDFKGRDGLIKTLKAYVPADHYIVEIVKKGKYRDALERLSALRNYAAHDSEASRTKAKAAVGQNRIGPAGAWLKSQERLETIADRLKELAQEIEAEAPYYAANQRVHRRRRSGVWAMDNHLAAAR